MKFFQFIQQNTFEPFVSSQKTMGLLSIKHRNNRRFSTDYIMRIMVVILISIITSCANVEFQQEENLLKAAMKHYINCTNNRDFECVISFLPNEVFTEADKRDQLKEMRAFYSIPQMQEFYIDSIFKIDTIIFENDVYYGRIQFHMCLLNDLSDFKNENGASYAVAASIMTQESKFGSENVDFDNESWVMTTRMKDYTYGYKPQSSEDWKIFGLTQKTESLIPEQIRKTETVRATQ
jgi:predicted ester cyclase